MPEFMSEEGNLVTIAFLFSGVMAMVMSFFFKVHSQKFVEASAKTQAIVENVKKVQKGASEYTIVFKDRNGEQITAKLAGGSGKQYKTGDGIEILYKKDTPEVVRRGSFEKDMMRVSKIMVGVAIFDIVAPMLLQAAGVIKITLWG